MTVKELIEKLQKFNENMTVCYDTELYIDDECNHIHESTDITNVYKKIREEYNQEIVLII